MLLILLRWEEGIKKEGKAINDNVPSICTYNPNYNSVLTNNGTKLIPYKIEEGFNKKKYVLQKLWKSYGASLDYKTVKLKSYIEERYKNELF